MNRPDGITYFTEGPPERLIADTDVQHAATWPAIERVFGLTPPSAPRS